MQASCFNIMSNKNEYYHKISKIIFFGGIFFLLFLFVKKINTVLTPFAISFILAYLFSPLAIHMQHRLKISKTVTSALIVISMWIVVISILTVITPIVYTEAASFFKLTPDIIKLINEKVIPLIPDFLKETYDQIIKEFGFQSLFKKTLDSKTSVLSHAYNSGIVIANLVSTIFLVPILTFYMLRDWAKIHKTVLNLIPINYKSEFEVIIHEIRKKVSGYVTGEFYVILILSTLYGVGLMLAKLKFGLFIGILTGILSIIPYVGFSLCFIAAILVAFATNMTYMDITIICAVFFIIQIIESNYIVPRLVGSKVGLHPLWIIFGLFAGGSLLGFIGLLLAIPITTIVSVLIKYYIKKYKKSDYYED